MFRRILIANRGAVARRIVAACRRLGIESVAAHSDLDAGLPAVAEADSAARLVGYRPSDTYLDIEQVLHAAKKCGADAVHPGYGFLAENAKFAEAVAEHGMVFIGPHPDWISRMSHKASARALMESKGIDVCAGSDVVETLAAAERAAKDIGYPVMIKPAEGGGGIGMSVANNPIELSEKFSRSAMLAQSAFGDGSLYLEKLLSKPRHIEFQFLGNGDSLWMLGERDCSVQRRHQKLIAEAPAPGIDSTEIHRVGKHLSLAIEGYDSLGTVETLFDGESFGFLEMNTRLQVEHAVTEMSTGIDLVALQIQVAAGEAVQASDVNKETRCFAVEARLYAEDSDSQLPSTGRLRRFEWAPMDGVRIDAAYQTGNWITPYYDPLLAKVIGTGSTREAAIAKTSIALKTFEVEGIDTNAQLLQNILGSEPFILGRVHTSLLSDLL